MREIINAVLFDDNQIFNPHAAESRNIDAGLHGNHHVLLDDRAVKRRKAGLLVDVEADTVTQSVSEIVSVTGIPDHASGKLVTLLSGKSCVDSVEGGVLRLKNRCIDFLLLFICLSDNNGTGHV